MKDYKNIVGVFLFVLAVLFCLLAVANILDHITPLARGGDFASFVAGARLVREGEAINLYSINTQIRYETLIGSRFTLLPYLAFRNLPPVAVAFIPLTYLSLIPAFTVFMLINVVILLFFIFYITRKFRPLGGAALAAFAVFTFRPAITTLQLGQLSVFFLLLYGLLIAAIRDRKYSLAGVLAGLIVLRPQFLTVLPFLFVVAGDKGKFTKGVVATLGAVFVLSFIVSGKGLFQFPKFLLRTEVADLASPPWRMFSLLPLMSEAAFGLGVSRVWGGVITAVLYAVSLGLFAVSYRRTTFTTSVLILSACMLVFSPHVLPYDLTVLLVPFVAILGEVKKGTRRRWVWVIVAIVLWTFSLSGYLKVVYFAALVLLIFSLLFTLTVGVERNKDHA